VLALFGFRTQRDKDFFLKLTSVSGVGPRLAITILSGAPVEELAQAVSAGTSRGLLLSGSRPQDGRAPHTGAQVPGAAFLMPEDQTRAQEAKRFGALEEDVLSALVNLGYPKIAAEKAVASVVASGECERTFEDVLRHTLRRLSGQ